MSEAISGKCFCGQLKFHYTPPSAYIAHCHCGDCRQAHGAGFITWVGIDSKQFHLDDDSTLKWFGEVETGRRGFCSECGTTLFFESSLWPGQMAVTRASLPEEIDREPSQHGFYDLRANWIPVINDELEKLTAEESFLDS